MKVEVSKQNNLEVTTFDSLNEFRKYIETAQLNSIFQPSSVTKYGTKTDSSGWAGTVTYQEAVSLLENGWSDKAKELETKLEANIKSIATKNTRRSTYDVVGGNASVPRYLQGVPTNMINQKTVAMKQKVLTLNKDISYSAGVQPNEIVENSINTFLIIRKLENEGYRINLNLVWAVAPHSNTNSIMVKVRLKNAGERLNISKMAFPLVHPAMLRRFFFRFLEVTPSCKSNTYTGGYGQPASTTNLEKWIGDKEVVLPRFIKREDIENICKNILK